MIRHSLSQKLPQNFELKHSRPYLIAVYRLHLCYPPTLPEMEYTCLNPISRGLVLPSPTTPYLASASGNCLDIHDITTLTLLHTTTASGPITSLHWAHSPTLGALVCAATTPPNTALVLQAQTGTVLHDLHETPLSTISLTLSPTATHLIQTFEHSLTTVIHNLIPHRKLTLQYPKHPSLIAHSPCRRYLALVTRKNSTDGLLVLHLPTFSTTFSLRGPSSLAGISAISGLSWPKAGILIWGSPTDPLSHRALALFDRTGTLLMTGDPSTESAIRLASASIEQPRPPPFAANPLGICAVAVNNSGTLAAVTGHDRRLRLVNLATWMQVGEFAHDSPVVDDVAPPVIFRETLKHVDDDEEHETEASAENRSVNITEQHPPKALKRSYFEVVDCLSMPTIAIQKRPRAASKTPTTGISHVAFSSEGLYLASRSDEKRNVVFVWDVAQVRLASVLVLREDARSLAWSRTNGEDGPVLAVVTGGEYVYIWRRSGAAAVCVRPEQPWREPFRAGKALWAYDDSAVVVADGISAKAFLVVYVT